MTQQRKTAMRFIILMGVVSLFGDITYEGGRSVSGPYLAFLGAGAVAVGLVSGLGEFLGYSLRLIFGAVADRTRAYWPLTIIGYALIFSIPLLAWAGNWQTAAVLIILERVGKAIRAPSRDAILSYATKEVGRGWGFAVHEAFDQIGAILGPLLFSLVFVLKGGYSRGFALLWLPSVLTLAFLLFAKSRVPVPQKLESAAPLARGDRPETAGLSKIYWLYALFISLSIMGFANFQIISYHFKTCSVIPDTQIPLFYCLAMAVDGLAALGIGKAYDKIGLKTLFILPLLTAAIPFLAFSLNYSLALAGIILWGVVMGTQETIMRAAIADLTHISKRGTAYGIFNAIYGGSWFIGSVLIGFLYQSNRNFIPWFVVLTQLASLPVFFLWYKRR